MTREQLLRRSLDKSRMAGIEIGPFFNPLLPKAEGWRTTVVDYADETELRAIAANHSAPVIRENAHRIEPVDIVWNREPLDELCLRLRPDGYDFLVASNVIEHIPDLIGFLGQLSRILRPAGIVNLAIPDIRFCFDYFKPLSSTADLLAAHREKRRIHAPETIFEAFAYPAHVADNGAWLRSDSRVPVLVGSLAGAAAQYRPYCEGWAAGTQNYVDAHCWKFTPASFELAMLEVNALGLIDWMVADLAETEGTDFIARLTRGRYSGDAAETEARRSRLLQQVVVEMSARGVATKGAAGGSPRIAIGARIKRAVLTFRRRRRRSRFLN
jgi:SAM-dependent methyltransferase